MGVDPVIRSKGDLFLLALPFVMMAAMGVIRLAVGPGWGLLPLLVVGPAVAAAVGGPAFTLAAGAVALAECVLFMIGMFPDSRPANVAGVAVIGVTVVGAALSRTRELREREFARVRMVAEAAQQVLLRPVPDQVGSVRMAVRYLSASTGARVGGDLYEVVATPDRVRLIVGDVEGKGLPAIQSASVVLGVFREAAHEDIDLPGIAARIETSLARELGDEQFVTAVLADVAVHGTKMDLLSCGHPAPLMLGAPRPQFVGPDEGGLPLGLGQLTGAPRVPLTIPFAAGDQILFYTDGASEARNKAGEFFALDKSRSLGCVTGAAAAADPAVLVGKLSDEVVRHVGHAPDDDVALLLACRLATPAG
jgi:serine phosphatase RsbU (regulator of sigma subunit)